MCSEPDLGGPYSLVPRLSPSFPSLAIHLTVLQATGSWAKPPWPLSQALAQLPVACSTLNRTSSNRKLGEGLGTRLDGAMEVLLHFLVIMITGGELVYYGQLFVFHMQCSILTLAESPLAALLLRYILTCDVAAKQVGCCNQIVGAQVVEN